MSDELRQRFTENAKEFDSLMILMLAENNRLTQQVYAARETLSALLGALDHDQPHHAKAWAEETLEFLGGAP